MRDNAVTVDCVRRDKYKASLIVEGDTAESFLAQVSIIIIIICISRQITSALMIKTS